MDYSGETRASEASLIERARQSDEVAWVMLVRLHQEPVFRFAYLLLSDADDAEDVAQETFIRAYRALNNFDLERPLRPWLLSIAANLSRNRRRSAGRYLAALQRWQQETAHKAGSSEQVFTRQWQSERLWMAIRKLGRDDQQVIYMRYFLDIPVEETAQSLSIAPGTVKSRLHRAMKRLRQVIAHDFPDLAGNENNLDQVKDKNE